jgi:hypothetical protein
MINIRRIEKRWFLLLIVIHADRSRLCSGAEAHKRGIAQRMAMVHKA